MPEGIYFGCSSLNLYKTMITMVDDTIPQIGNHGVINFFYEISNNFQFSSILKKQNIKIYLIFLYLARSFKF